MRQGIPLWVIAVRSRVSYYRQRLILGTMAVLWAGILPWLCWGGWSTPGHPHATPHFVFAKPPLHDASHHLHAPALPDPHEQDELAGVARPDTLLLALLVVLVTTHRVVIGLRTHYFARRLPNFWAHVATMTVPTPPPRMAPAAS